MDVLTYVCISLKFQEIFFLFVCFFLWFFLFLKKEEIFFFFFFFFCGSFYFSSRDGFRLGVSVLRTFYCLN